MNVDRRNPNLYYKNKQQPNIQMPPEEGCKLPPEEDCNSNRLMRLRYLSHRRPAKAQASLRIRAVSPEPSLFAHMNYGNRWWVRPKSWHLAPLYSCARVSEEWIYGGQKVPKSHELAHFIEQNTCSCRQNVHQVTLRCPSGYVMMPIRLR